LTAHHRGGGRRRLGRSLEAQRGGAEAGELEALGSQALRKRLERSAALGSWRLRRQGRCSGAWRTPR